MWSPGFDCPLSPRAYAKGAGEPSNPRRREDDQARGGTQGTELVKLNHPGGEEYSQARGRAQGTELVKLNHPGGGEYSQARGRAQGTELILLKHPGGGEETIKVQSFFY